MPARRAQLFTQAEVQSVSAPIDQAATLPARAYTDEDIHRAEIERIFASNWSATCFAHTLPDPGDARPIEFLGIPLLVVRGCDRRVRVFHNICPYDGCPVLLTEARGLSELVTLYHGWTYDLLGRLLRIPYWSGDQDPSLSVLGDRPKDLIEVRSETRLGLVFVNIDGRAASVDDYLAPLFEELSDYDLTTVVPVEDDDGPMARIGRTVKANWKTYLENAAINVLHEAFTHEAYRKSPEVPRVKNGVKTYFDVAHGPLMALGYLLGDFAKTYGLTATMPHLGMSTTAPPRKGYFITLFPNVVMPIQMNMFRLNICLPEGPGQTRVLHCSFMRPNAVAVPDFAAYHLSLVELFHQAYREDAVAIEAIQRARRSPVFTQHFYSPFWDAQHHHFNRLVMDQMSIGTVKPDVL